MTKLDRFEPTSIIAGNAFMEVDKYGRYVSLDDILNFVKNQRNDIPCTGFEMANAIAFVCGKGENYFRK